MAYELKKWKKIIRAEIVNLHPAMRAFTDSFIVSNPGKTTQSVNFTTVLCILIKTDFFTGKMIVTAWKRYFRIVVPQLDVGVFQMFVAKRQRI